MAGTERPPRSAAEQRALRCWWVARERCDTDRRVVYARLTPRGEALMDQAFPRHAQGIARRLSVLGAREQDALRVLLRRARPRGNAG